MFDLNFLAILLAAVLYFVIGMVWYSPQLFGKAWMEAHPGRDEDMKCCYKSMVGTFVLGLVIAYVMDLVLDWINLGNARDGALCAFWLWLGFVATTHFSGVLWERKPLKSYLIHMGYLLIAFISMGAVLGAWG